MPAEAVVERRAGNVQDPSCLRNIVMGQGEQHQDVFADELVERREA